MQLKVHRILTPPAVVVPVLIFLACLAAVVGLPQPGNAASPDRVQPVNCLQAPCQDGQRLFLPLIGQGARQTPANLFGLQMYGWLDTGSAGLDLAQRANVNWLRTQLAWEAVEPANTSTDKFNFASYDASFARAQAMGFRLIVTILDNPSWAATYRNGPINPTALDDFSSFINAAIERYDGDGIDDAPGSPVVDYWEFYNEPDGGDKLRAERGEAYWGHYGAAYAAMLCTVRPGLKAANPRAQMVFGGIAHDYLDVNGGPFVQSFPNDVLAAGGGKCFDVMNFHYYPVFAPGWAQYGPGLTGKANYLRSLLASYNLGDMPFFCTEAGWHSDPTFDPPSSPQEQANYVAKLFTQAAAGRVEMMIWWTWIDPGPLVGGFGLVTTDLQAKPAYHAYRVAALKLGSAQFMRTMTSDELDDPGVEGHIFQRSQPLYVMWANDGAEHQVRLAASTLLVTDVDASSQQTLNDAADGAVDGWVTVQVGAKPLYVEAMQSG
jgi:hypothetical protein